VLVGAGEGERITVGVAVTVAAKGPRVGDIVEWMGGVETAGALSPHPTRESKTNIKKTSEYLLMTIRL
jgi:hypothetical protein